MPPAKHQINLYIHIKVARCTRGDFTPVLRQTRMVRPLYKRAVKGARNRTGTSKKRTKEEIHVTNFKQVQFSILFL